MLTETNPELLCGTVEVDECFVDGLEKNKHTRKKVIRSKVSRTLAGIAAAEGIFVNVC